MRAGISPVRHGHVSQSIGSLACAAVLADLPGTLGEFRGALSKLAAIVGG